MGALSAVGDFSVRYASNGECGAIFQDLPAMGASVPFILGTASLVAGWSALKIGLKASAGWSGSSIDYGRCFDIVSSPDASVRSPVAFSQSLPDAFALVNAELRGPDLAFFIPPLFNTRLGLFLFADLCAASCAYTGSLPLGSSFRSGEAPVSGGGLYFLDAYGIGLRAGFALPVNVYFTFTYGINRFGAAAFGIVASNGF